MTSNRPASAAKTIRRQLLVLAKERRDDFNLVVIRYGLERLLYRLSRSRYRNDFILKGAMLFTLWSAENYRSTRDLDLLGRGLADHERLRLIFAEICTTPCDDDGMTFLASSVETRDIRADTEYRGLRVDLTCDAESDQERLQRHRRRLTGSAAAARLPCPACCSAGQAAEPGVFRMRQMGLQDI